MWWGAEQWGVHDTQDGQDSSGAAALSPPVIEILWVFLGQA